MEYLKDLMNTYDTISRAYAEAREEGLLARTLLNNINDLINGLN
ncbi:hypothetical protein [Vulcanisaeta sp. JCM 16159]